MDSDRPRLREIDAALAAFLALLAGAVYVATLTPSLSYLSPDGDELATVPYVLGLAHSPGYPIYTWLGKAFTWLPFGDVAHRVNLMSAVLGALGVAGLYLILVQLIPDGPSPALRRVAALAAAGLFAFSPTFWSQAVIAEVYAPNLAFVALTLLALLRWERTRRDRDFFWFALAFGLSLGMHLSDLGFAPAFAVFVLLTERSVIRRPRWWLAALAGFGLGAAQFAWLPYKAGTLNDGLMLAHAPSTLQGIYAYTLGAFRNFRFAFPIIALPDRLVIYLDLLQQEFSLAGIALGLLGLIALLFRRPAHFFLLAGMYLVHVWFFIQYRAFDLEVFFLPAHFLWAAFIGFGAAEVMARLATPGLLPSLGRLAAAGAVALTPLSPLLTNWSANNHSGDTAVNDFYANVWELLPPGSVLLTRTGVFGYDAFYWRLAYGVRQDVLIPALTTPRPEAQALAGRALFATAPVTSAQNPGGPGALPAGLLASDLWQVPVLFGASSAVAGGSPNRLVLYRLTSQPPDVRDQSPELAETASAEFGDLALVGVEVSPAEVESGGRIHLVLYWRLGRSSGQRVTTALGDLRLETHPLGMGNLERYGSQVGPLQGKILVEDYWVVVPSSAAPGVQELRLAVGSREASLGRLTVVNREEAMERWLRAAGS